MAVSYNNDGRGHRYNCSRLAVDYGEAFCQSLKGNPLDDLVSELVLQALQPAALEVSLRVAEDVEGEREQRRLQWAQRLEQARYDVERAFRQYNAVEPENRLVARSLERQWEDSLAAEEKLKADYAHAAAREPMVLTAADREAIRRLASDVPALWHAPTTTMEDRQTIIRELVERVVVTVQGESEKVDVIVLWAGGHKMQATLVRPVARLDQLSYYPELSATAARLRDEGLGTDEIAARLNSEAWRPPKRRSTFTAAMVCTLLARHTDADAPLYRRPVRCDRQADEWTLRELARELSIPSITLFSWLQRGMLKSRCVDSPRRLWLIEANATELQRLRDLRKAPRTWRRPALPEARSHV
jgi:hypothetical protein